MWRYGGRWQPIKNTYIQSKGVETVVATLKAEDLPIEPKIHEDYENRNTDLNVQEHNSPGSGLFFFFFLGGGKTTKIGDWLKTASREYIITAQWQAWGWWLLEVI